MAKIAELANRSQQRAFRLYRCVLLCFALITVLLSSFAHAQDECDSFEVFPVPALQGDDLTLRAFRFCPTSGGPVRIEISVVENSIRVDTQCAATPLPAFDCQVGEAPLPMLEAGTYTIELYDQQSGAFIFSDSLIVGPAAAIPTLQLSGLALLALLMLLIGTYARIRQANRSR